VTTAITDPQRRVLDVIAAFIEQYGYPPTVREIADRCGYASKNAAADHLNALERKGYIEIDRFTARGIRIVAARETAA
jgi:repressor LexA